LNVCGFALLPLASRGSTAVDLPWRFFVHPGFGEVEAGFFVALVGGEFLSEVVGDAVFGGYRALAGVVRDLLAERLEIAAGNDVALGISHHPRRAEMVFGPIPSLLIWDWGFGISDFATSVPAESTKTVVSEARSLFPVTFLTHLPSSSVMNRLNQSRSDGKL